MRSKKTILINSPTNQRPPTTVPPSTPGLTSLRGLPYGERDRGEGDQPSLSKKSPHAPILASLRLGFVPTAAVALVKNIQSGCV